MQIHLAFSLAWLFGNFVAYQALVVGAPQTEAGFSPEVPMAVGAACNTAYAIAAETPGVSIQRSAGLLSDETLPQPTPGCELAIAGSFARAGDGRDATVRLREGFAARSWREVADWSADGKDGTRFAFRTEAVQCLFRGSWNGGADGEPEIPAEDGYEVSVLCISLESP